jgi:hypothetical protein
MHRSADPMHGSSARYEGEDWEIAMRLRQNNTSKNRENGRTDDFGAHLFGFLACK